MRPPSTVGTCSLPGGSTTQPGPSPSTQIAPNQGIKVVKGEIHLSPSPQVFYLHQQFFTDFILELEARMPKKEM